MKTKKLNEKGITLIALVITIVVLIILATVSINMILNDNGIMGAAELAKEKYQNAATKEQSELGNMEEVIENYKEKWVYDEEKQEVTKGDVTLKIWQKVEYNEGIHTTKPDITRGIGSSYNTTTKKLETKQYSTQNNNLEWRVLGVNEKGQLELISTNLTTDTIALYGKAGFANLETKNGVKGTLDTFCDELYGKGVGADSARSLSIYDVLSRFDTPVNPPSKIKCTFQYDPNTETVKKTNDATKPISEWIDTGLESVQGIAWTVDSSNKGPEVLESLLYGDSYILNNKITTKIDDGKISLSKFLAWGEAEDPDANITVTLSQTTFDYYPDPTHPIFCAAYGLINASGTYNFSSCANFYTLQTATEGSSNNLHIRPVVALKLDTVIDSNGNIEG